jgi:hypothetical protein
MTARHAATDGSFGRSAGGAAARGAGLLLVAVVLGILLLRSGGGDPYGRSVRTAASPSPVVTSLPTATTVTVPVRSPADVKTLPVNGTTTANAAAATGAKLKAAGYNVLAATNTTKAATASNVFYEAGYEREARVVAQLLGLPDSAVQPMPTPPPVPDTRGANLIVVVGPDLARAAPPVTSPPTTARRAVVTTARPATATTAKPTTATTARAVTTTTKKA